MKTPAELYKEKVEYVGAKSKNAKYLYNVVGDFGIIMNVLADTDQQALEYASILNEHFNYIQCDNWGLGPKIYKKAKGL